MIDDLVLKRIRVALSKAPYIDAKPVITGRRIDDETVTLSGAPVGKSWVRSHDSSREETAVWGDATIINLPVLIKPLPSGEYKIDELDWARAVAAYGAAAGAGLIPRGIDDITQRSIDGLGFKPGRIEWATSGGMNIHIPDFAHSGGVWRGVELQGNTYVQINDFSVTSYIPATSGHVGWVVIYLIPSANSLAAKTGSTIAGTLDTLMLSATAPQPGDITLPPNVYPLGAVGLAYGQTEIDPRIIVDIPRQHLSSNFDVDDLILDDTYEFVLDDLNLSFLVED